MRNLIALGVALVALALAPARAQDSPSHSHHHHGQSTPAFHKSFKDAKEWAKIFDDPARDVWQKPAEVVAALKLEPTDKIADIGAGTGYFAWRLANAVPQGKVFAIDIEKDMVDFLATVREKESVPNLIPVLASETDPRIPEKVNMVIVVDTYHHIDSRIEYFKQIREKLLDNGRLIIIDFRASSKEGPPLKHRVSPDEVRRELSEAGYSQEQSLDFLPNQYFVIFKARQP